MDKLIKTTEYKDFIESVKSKIQSSQIKAAVRVNVEFLKLYWELAQNIVEKQQHTSWGDGFIEQISKDLKDAFPNMKGFSRSNLLYMKKWYLFFSDGRQGVTQIDENGKSQQAVGELKKVQQVVAQIFQIPWGHNIAIISKIKNHEEALYYVNQKIGRAHV